MAEHASRGAAEPRTLDRRRFLSLAAGSMGAASLATLPMTRSASAQPEPFAFGLVGDTQVGLHVPERTKAASWIYQDMAARNASVVCHVGDLMEYGSLDEYDEYLSTIPDELFPRMRHVPGNHEWRWDPTARERYREHLGATRYSFDAGGIRFIALDPSNLLQEGGTFGEQGIAWLVDELDQAPSEAPIILMCHFPFGHDNYYVKDQERLLEIFDSYNVRSVFAGHIHREEVHRFNGITQLAVDDSMGPRYYWLERQSGPGGAPVLQVTKVERTNGGTETREVTSIPLGGPPIARHERPQSIDLDAEAGALGVAVRLRPPARGASVEAQLYPQHNYALKHPGNWQELSADASGRRFTGTLDVSELPPGIHRMQVKVIGTEGAWHETTRDFDLPGADRIRWQVGLGAPVQAGLASDGDLLVAATTDGTVVAGRPTDAGFQEQWRASIGAVKGRPVFAPDDTTVYVPSVDHRLHAFNPENGATRFAYDAGEPVLGSPLLAEIAGDLAVIFGAGETLHVIDATTGAGRWSTGEQGMFVGRAACDGNRVYTGGGDGHAYAFDAVTGETLWSFLTNTRDSAYRRLIYGPWYDSLELLPEGRVLVSNVTNAFALDTESGEEAWSLDGSYGFAPKVRLGTDLLIIDDWLRTVSRIDAVTGGVRWTTDIGVRVLNTGAAVHEGTAWVHGTTGQLTAVDLEAGTILERLQLTSTDCYSPPAIVGGMLVAADQDGTVHGLTLDG